MYILSQNGYGLYIFSPKRHTNILVYLRMLTSNRFVEPEL
jgi:hypothetical protein